MIDPASQGRPFGRFRLIEVLGAGGMGVVHRAWDGDLRRMIAIKEILGEAGPELRARFLREARLAARLDHPHIVRVHEVGERDGRRYLAMDLVEGSTLAELLAAERPEARGSVSRLRNRVAILARVADAVGYAHREGIVHRDLKPSNSR
mgnify:CR=1 FL=1